MSTHEWIYTKTIERYKQLVCKNCNILAFQDELADTPDFVYLYSTRNNLFPKMAQISEDEITCDEFIIKQIIK